MIFLAGGNAYSLLHEHKSGWNPEAFRERFSDVLERFDYIVGDWGYNQLRLRGFYRDGHPRATKETAISSFVDYINEYCNFGCAHFVLTKLDSNALPADAVISKETSPEAIVAMNETGEQAAETAAAAMNGPIMRWPLKERLGGPVRVPNVTVSAVARAAAEAERRNSNSSGGFSQSSSSGRGSHSRGGQDGGSSNRQGRSFNNGSSGGDRRQQGQGGSSHVQNGTSGNKPSYPPRGPRPQQGDSSSRSSSTGEDQGKLDNNQGNTRNNEGPHNDGPRNESRWPGKNRRRKSFGGKPSQRPEGAPLSESGNPRSSE
jgi:uncharacterized protein YutD